jgi:hypothetical protein
MMTTRADWVRLRPAVEPSADDVCRFKQIFHAKRPVSGPCELTILHVDINSNDYSPEPTRFVVKHVTAAAIIQGAKSSNHCTSVSERDCITTAPKALAKSKTAKRLRISFRMTEIYSYLLSRPREWQGWGL